MPFSLSDIVFSVGGRRLLFTKPVSTVTVTRNVPEDMIGSPNQFRLVLAPKAHQQRAKFAQNSMPSKHHFASNGYRRRKHDAEHNVVTKVVGGGTNVLLPIEEFPTKELRSGGPAYRRQRQKSGIWATLYFRKAINVASLRRCRKSMPCSSPTGNNKPVSPNSKR